MKASGEGMDRGITFDMEDWELVSRQWAERERKREREREKGGSGVHLICFITQCPKLFPAQKKKKGKNVLGRCKYLALRPSKRIPNSTSLSFIHQTKSCRTFFHFILFWALIDPSLHYSITLIPIKLSLRRQFNFRLSLIFPLERYSSGSGLSFKEWSMRLWTVPS